MNFPPFFHETPNLSDNRNLLSLWPIHHTLHCLLEIYFLSKWVSLYFWILNLIIQLLIIRKFKNIWLKINNLDMVVVFIIYPILIVTDIHIIKVWPETGYINHGRDYNLRLKFISIFYTWNLYGMLHPLLYKSCFFLRLMSCIIKIW